MWKQFLNDYFDFTRKERKGILALIGIIVAFSIAPLFFKSPPPTSLSDVALFQKEMSELLIDTSERGAQNYYSSSERYSNYSENVNFELFNFDPNTISVQDWMRLGIKEKIALNIQKYLSKGGKFYKPEDLKKIWGIPEKDINRLLPYVKITPAIRENVNNENRDLNRYSKAKFKTFAPIDINQSDSTDWLSLPGIGPAYTRRILSFRSRLGGFISVDQVKETYLLPDSVFQKIQFYLRYEPAEIRKINLNEASVEELKAHPYIRFQYASVIVEYRNQHGLFKRLEDLKKIMIIPNQDFEKMLPYLTL